MPIEFKSYLNSKSKYKGGKSMSEVRALVGDKPIYKMSSNENPLGSSPKATEAVKKIVDNLFYYPDNTDTRLRQALENFYGGQLNADQFLTTNSGVANIELIIRGFMEEGTEAIYSNPAFGPYKGFPLKLGAKCIDIALTGDDFNLDVNGILNAINDKTRLIFITSPNNPTGTHLPKKQIDELVENLPDHVILVFDEVYYQYADAQDYVRALPYVLEGKNVIAVNSFSKAYGLAGLRVGYSYSTPEISTYLRQLRIPFMINSLSMDAAIAALGDDDFIKRTVEMVHGEKQFLYKELDKLNVKYWKTQANFILVKPKISAEEFEEAMVKEGVMVRPVAGFGAPGCVRVTIHQRAGNKAFVNAWKEILEKENQPNE